MKSVIGKVLDHPDLTIELCKDQSGQLVYVGRSKKYEPNFATSRTALRCLFKFYMLVEEQRKLSQLINQIPIESVST